MIITQTPFRMSFFGGGTDIEDYFREEKGAVLSTNSKREQLREMYDLVGEAETVLTNKEADLDEFGRLLDHTWRLKRQTGFNISTDSIDGLYEKGIGAGALGGKLLGAGGGGFLLFYVPVERQHTVREAMKDLLYIPFRFENAGTRVIYYVPEEYQA